MSSLSMTFGGEWFPMAGEYLDNESPVERAARLAHLREAREREIAENTCPVCGMPGALLDGGDRYHGEGLCDSRKGDLA